MRRMIPQNLADYIKSLQEVIARDGLKIQFGNDVEIDGSLKINTNLTVDGTIEVEDLQHLVDENGDSIIPDPTGHTGEFLKHTSTGYGWGTPSPTIPSPVHLPTEQPDEPITESMVRNWFNQLSLGALWDVYGDGTNLIRPQLYASIEDSFMNSIALTYIYYEEDGSAMNYMFQLQISYDPTEEDYIVSFSEA